MKKIFIILFLIFWIFSCSSSESTTSDWLISYDKSEIFSLRIPEKWEIIDHKNKIPNPRTWQIELIISSKDSTNDFYNNLTIWSELLEKNLNNSEYFKSVNLEKQKDFFEYKEIENKKIVFADGKESDLSIFEARYDNSTPKAKYLQTVNICGDNKAYFLTMSISNSIESTKNHEYVLSTFSCKK